MPEEKNPNDPLKKKPRKILAFKKKEEQKIPATKERAIGKEAEPFGILKFVLMTEKSIRMIEAENKLVFIVDRKFSKRDIKTAFEEVFGSPVSDIKTSNDQKGRKRAFIKLKVPGMAGEIAIRLGII